MFKLLFVVLLLSAAASADINKFSDAKLKDLKGNEVSFSKYEGQCVLVINTASGCGFTKVNMKYLNKLKELHPNFNIVAFSSNSPISNEVYYVDLKNKLVVEEKPDDFFIALTVSSPQKTKKRKIDSIEPEDSASNVSSISGQSSVSKYKERRLIVETKLGRSLNDFINERKKQISDLSINTSVAVDEKTKEFVFEVMSKFASSQGSDMDMKNEACLESLLGCVFHLVADHHKNFNESKDVQVIPQQKLPNKNQPNFTISVDRGNLKYIVIELKMTDWWKGMTQIMDYMLSTIEEQGKELPLFGMVVTMSNWIVIVYKEQKWSMYSGKDVIELNWKINKTELNRVIDIYYQMLNDN